VANPAAVSRGVVKLVAVSQPAVNRAVASQAVWTALVVRPAAQAQMPAVANRAVRARTPQVAQLAVRVKAVVHRAADRNRRLECHRQAEALQAPWAFPIRALDFQAVVAVRAAVQKVAGVLPILRRRSPQARAATPRVKAFSPGRAVARQAQAAPRAAAASPVGKLAAGANRAAQRAPEGNRVDHPGAEATRVARAPTRRAAVALQVVQVRMQVVVASRAVARLAVKQVEFRTRAANQGAALQAELAVNRAAERVVKAAVRTAVAVRAAVGR
jgi:hypothetical protein